MLLSLLPSPLTPDLLRAYCKHAQLFYWNVLRMITFCSVDVFTELERVVELKKYNVQPNMAQTFYLAWLREIKIPTAARMASALAADQQEGASYYPFADKKSLCDKIEQIDMRMALLPSHALNAYLAHPHALHADQVYP